MRVNSKLIYLSETRRLRLQLRAGPVHDARVEGPQPDDAARAVRLPHDRRRQQRRAVEDCEGVLKQPRGIHVSTEYLPYAVSTQ